ncbi:GcrA family cell cycle regulator [Aureimonas pseudogalii]|uniref:GcrA cell cycle regulator n=1 Tax=Aureimonas pseudogalii TaxID=1744844 RepID=A0A7W6EEZ9_9HYPH|nr:GcrA family cell cycle regulator [Aureimonas pseudogalii]MBB3997440.1 GcrA cell cycle regulator [Aureimonas pseudogalii]
MSWTDERIDLLKRLWGEGQSASQIAGQLGGVTRNAVIGKVHRLKLDSRLKSATAAEMPVLVAVPKPSRPVLVESVPVPAPEIVAAPRILTPVQATPMQATPVPATTAPSRPTLHAVMGANALKIEPEEDVLGEVETIAEPRPSGEVVPISRNLTLVQLSERTCKWPLGDPLSAEFRFCGNHSHDASPYCQYHARIAFQPVSERRRAR